MKRKDWVKFFVVIFCIGLLTYLSVNGLRIPKTNFVIPQANVPGLNKVIPNAQSVRTGIDIRGGVRAILSAPDGVVPTDKQIDTARLIIERRLDAKNIFDRTVTAETTNGRVIVEIPWKQGETDFNPQKAIDEIGQTALLTFQEVDEEAAQNGTIAPTGKIIVQGMDIQNAAPMLNPETNRMEVSLEFTQEAGQKFEEATGRLIGKRIAIFMDNQLISAPTVNSRIPAGNGARISLGSGDADTIAKEASDLAGTIRAGALPFKLEAKQVTSISPSLGENALYVTLIAGLISLIGVWLFMLLYYRMPGFIANIALLGHTVILILLFAWLGLTLTLPGIAGIILTIGMSVDTNIIIFARIKEELKNGKTLRAAIDTGFHRAFSAILDANATTLISSIVLYIFGSGPIQSFAITLGIGVVLNFLTAVTASRIMLKSVSGMNIAKHPWLYGA